MAQKSTWPAFTAAQWRALKVRAAADAQFDAYYMNHPKDLEKPAMKPFNRSHVSQAAFEQTFRQTTLKAGDVVSIERPCEVMTPSGLASDCKHWTEEKEAYVGLSVEIINVSKGACGFDLCRVQFTHENMQLAAPGIEDMFFLAGHLALVRGTGPRTRTLRESEFHSQYKESPINIGDEVRLFEAVDIQLTTYMAQNLRVVPAVNYVDARMHDYAGMRAIVKDIERDINGTQLLSVDKGLSWMRWRAGDCRLLRAKAKSYSDAEFEKAYITPAKAEAEAPVHLPQLILQQDRERHLNKHGCAIGDMVKLSFHCDLTIANPDGSRYHRGSEWHPDMTPLVGPFQRVTEAFHENGMAWIKVAGSPRKFRARSATVYEEDLGECPPAAAITPFPKVSPPTYSGLDFNNNKFWWLPKRLHLNKQQFEQRYMAIDLIPGDKVIILPHPMLWITAELGQARRVGNFAKSHDVPDMQKWFGQIVTVEDVNFDTYDVNGVNLTFKRFQAKEINEAQSRIRYFRAGDCIPIYDSTERQVRYNNLTELRSRANELADEHFPGSEALQPTLGELLFRDSAIRQANEEKVLQRALEPKPAHKAVDPETDLDRKRKQHIRRLLEEHAAALEQAVRQEEQLVAIGAKENLPKVQIKALMGSGKRR